MLDAEIAISLEKAIITVELTSPPLDLRPYHGCDKILSTSSHHTLDAFGRQMIRVTVSFKSLRPSVHV